MIRRVFLQAMVLFSIITLSLAAMAVAFPAHQSLAGLSREELEAVLPMLKHRSPESPPGPLNDTSTKLVNDAAHPWKPLRRGDIRGPCPGLNTLASHGYLPRNGIASPAQIINAIQEGFNMGNDIATFLTFAAFIVDGNAITNLMSIGGKSPLTGPDPPSPAIVGGLDTHAVFEGDASMTRGDAFFGDNHSFNETQFEEFSSFSQRFGAGKYNLTVAAEFRFQRIQESIATNPNFSFISPRYFTAYAEAVFPVLYFVDGRVEDGQLDMDAARSFFQHSRMPEGFFRANRSMGSAEVGQGIDQVFAPHPIQPGKNQGVGNYVLDPASANLSDGCLAYTNFVNGTVRSLYPNPTGALRTALNTNLDIFFGTVGNCTQVFPFGQ
ncbi:Chloroperoxidase [Gautieria morchelliformis]|nr:Chloroperoxidase [Gautieria morchelliformis]